MSHLLEAWLPSLVFLNDGCLTLVRCLLVAGVPLFTWAFALVFLLNELRLRVSVAPDDPGSIPLLILKVLQQAGANRLVRIDQL